MGDTRQTATQAFNHNENQIRWQAIGGGIQKWTQHIWIVRLSIQRITRMVIFKLRMKGVIGLHRFNRIGIAVAICIVLHLLFVIINLHKGVRRLVDCETEVAVIGIEAFVANQLRITNKDCSYETKDQNDVVCHSALRCDDCFLPRQ